MEKASTPSTNRLTRSSAKNTPRKLDQEDSLDHSAAEDIKHNLRKSSRKVETKPKTNGDNSNSLDCRKLNTVEEMSDGNSIDGCNSEDSNLSMKQSSPTLENYKTSPVISRRSLRARRSITPGPEFNSSAMKRSTSEGKLSTPNSRRTSRAKSESKDFVFTPSKTKSNDSESSVSIEVSNSKHTRRKSTLRVIDKIVEEESNPDELQHHSDPKRKSVDITNKSNSPPKTKIDKIVEEESTSVELGQESDLKEKSVGSTKISNSPPKTKIDKIFEEETTSDELGQESDPKGKSVDSTNKSNSPPKTKTDKIIKEKSNLDELGQESDPKGKSVGSTSNSNSSPKTKIDKIVEEESTSDELGQESDPEGKSVDSTNKSNSPPKTKIDKIIKEKSNLDELRQKSDPKGKSVDSTNKSNSPPKTKMVEIVKEKSILVKLGQESDPKGNSVDSTKNKSNSPPQTETLHNVSVHSEDNALPLNASEINKSPLSKINKSNTEEEMNLEISQPFEEVSISLAEEKANQSEISQLSDDKENESKMETCKSTGKDSLGQIKLLSMSQESVVQEDDYNMDTSKGTEKDVVEKSCDLAKENRETAKMDVVSESTGVEETVSEPNDKPTLSLTTEMEQKDTPGKNDPPKQVSEATSVVDETYNAMVFENNNIDSVIVIEETESVDELISEASAETTSPSLVKNEPSFVEGKDLENNVPVDNKSITVCNLSSDKQNNDSEVSRVENDECFISDETTVLNATRHEKTTSNSYDKNKSPENDTSTHSITINCEKVEDNVVAVVIEDSNSNSTGSAGKDMSENLTSREEIFMEEVGEESIEKADLNVIVEPDNDEITQPSTTVPVENTVVEDKSMPMQVPENINITVEDDRKKLTQIKSDSSITESCEQNKTSERSLVQQQMTYEMYGDDFNDRKTTKDEDENSGSDSDIYKGLSLSDYGSDGDHKLKDGKCIQFDETISSEPRSGESGEDYASSDDGNDYEEEEGEEEEEEEEEEGEEENVEEENTAGRDTLIKDEKNIQTSNGAGSGNPSGADSPMTYDKALAILNENREKKIDDEEFFDMFTQELNRVSEESGSDSDIAIVDEYIMDPEEEEAKKPSPNKKSNHLNVKQLQRPAPPPSIPLSQSFPLPDQYTAAYDQQNPPVSRMNFSHGGVYNSYSQGMPTMHDGRGALLYEQYATNIPNPRVFDPLETNYSGAQMFNNTLDPQMCFSGGPPLKVRSILAMNSSQPSNIMNANYAGPSQSAKSLEISPKDTVCTSERLGPLKAAEDGKEEGGSQSSLASRDTEEAVSSPILELLGLDREKLRLLKQVLGLDNKTKQSATRKQLKKMNVPKRLIKTRHRAKKVKQRRQKEIVKQIINSTFKTSTEHSSEEDSASSRSSHYALFKTFKPKSETRSSVETLKSGNREVNLEDGNVSVTIDTTRRTKARNRARRKSLKRARSTSSNSSEAGFELMRKCRRADGSSSESEPNIKPRKMTKKNVQNKKSPQKSHILKSKSGTFTVDALTSASQSSDAESLAAGPSMFLEELRRSVKSDVASGKNRLSNLFSQHSPQKTRASKSSEREVINSKRKQKVKKSLKLPADFLEKLAKDEGKPKRALSESGSEEVAEKPPRKMRKRGTKVKVKSALAEQDYIPLVTGGGATQFSLARLDRYNTLSAAEQVAQLRAAHLYGPNVQRITILDFKG